MSVLQCDRNGCENVMCERYSEQYGYICDECFEELVGSSGYPLISEFMNSKKQELVKINYARERCNKIFNRTNE